MHVRKIIRDYDPVYCPFCKSLKPMVKRGTVLRLTGRKQMWMCVNKRCRGITVNPLLEKK